VSQVEAGSNKMDKLEKYLDMRDRSASASPVRDGVADNLEHQHRRSKRSSVMSERYVLQRVAVYCSVMQRVATTTQIIGTATVSAAV